MNCEFKNELCYLSVDRFFRAKSVKFMCVGLHFKIRVPIEFTLRDTCSHCAKLVESARPGARVRAEQFEIFSGTV